MSGLHIGEPTSTGPLWQCGYGSHGFSAAGTNRSTFSLTANIEANLPTWPLFPVGTTDLVRNLNVFSQVIILGLVVDVLEARVAMWV